MMETDFKVKVGEFEGPMEVLLELIEKRKLHISDVSLSQVADEFIEHTKLLEDFLDQKYVSDLADFILIASTLLLIKSKSLLPNIELTEEEEQSIEELESRLARYKKYKNMSAELSKMFGNFLYFPQERKLAQTVFVPTSDITPVTLKQALEQVIQNIPKPEAPLPKLAIQKIISLEEMIERLSERMRQSLQTSFSSFTRTSADNKIHVIVSFLAMLELVKRGLVRVEQQKHFEDISIESENMGVPQY